MQAVSLPRTWRAVASRLFLAATMLAVMFSSGYLSSPTDAQAAPNLANAAQIAAPSFVYQTVHNGAQFDSGRDEVVDAAGNAYILARAYDSNNDVMVVKLAPDGGVLFTSYLRGSLTDYGTGLALDGQGGLWLSGWTDSADFPVVNAAQPVIDSRRSGFLARLSTATGDLLYSSFFGANGADEFHDIALNAAGEIYLVGVTDSTDFPTLNPLQPGLNLTSCFCDDAFVLRLSPDGQTILYGTYLGGSRDDQGDSIGVDAAGNIYVAGITKSDDFPTANPLQGTWGGDFDAWAARISADGASLDYSTLLGGSGTEYLGRLAVDDSGYVTLAGRTNSANYPITPGAFQTAFGGGLCGVAGFGQYVCYDAFVTRLAPDGGSFAYSTFLGGNKDDEARGVAVDSAGNAYVVGYATSPNFPPAGINTAAEIFVSSLDASGSQLRYSVTLASATANDGHGIALGPGNDIFFTGAQNAPADLYAARLAQGGEIAPPATPTPTPTDTPTPTPTAPPTPTPTPTAPPAAGSLHAGDLDGSGFRVSRAWRASVQVLVHDAGDNPLGDVTGSGSWSNGYSGGAQCLTGADGTCTLTTGDLRRYVRSVDFEVSNLAQEGSTYTPAGNHDPDGDSNGTAITVYRP